MAKYKAVVRYKSSDPKNPWTQSYTTYITASSPENARARIKKGGVEGYNARTVIMTGVSIGADQNKPPSPKVKATQKKLQKENHEKYPSLFGPRGGPGTDYTRNRTGSTGHHRKASAVDPRYKKK